MVQVVEHFLVESAACLDYKSLCLVNVLFVIAVVVIVEDCAQMMPMMMTDVIAVHAFLFVFARNLFAVY